MGPVTIGWKNVLSGKWSFFLNALLIAFGTAIFTLLLLAGRQFANTVTNNSKDIDLVVGAKGSPLQLILSSIFYVDFPTGNITLEEADKVIAHPMVKRSVPLALGDNYHQFRIVGTDTGYISLYALRLASGTFWKNDFEVTIGSNVARQEGLKPGARFYGAHGLTPGQEEHRDHAYIVTGVLQPQHNATDNLVLTGISSIWKMHETEAMEKENREHTAPERELTALLIQYHNPAAVVLFPRMINRTTNMQAASPALETARLFSLIGTGISTLKWFSAAILLIASVSIFISLHNSLKERRYDLAVMRIMGASRARICAIIVLEGVMLTFAGGIAGMLIGHGVLEIMGAAQEGTQSRITGRLFLKQEVYLLIAIQVSGILSALVPAVNAYRTDIALVLSKYT